VDDFIINFMYAYFSPMDPNDLLCMAWKAQRADVSRHAGGDLRAALNRVKAKTFVMPMSSDMFYPPADCQADRRLNSNRCKQSMDISRCSEPIPMRSGNSTSTWVTCLRKMFRPNLALERGRPLPSPLSFLRLSGLGPFHNPACPLLVEQPSAARPAPMGCVALASCLGQAERKKRMGEPAASLRRWIGVDEVLVWERER
jgi:hypothetical protein